ncbi:MAG: hypothetical protein ACLPW4_11890, partial [Candidatus Sulfotelmatobacter sp.]
MEEETHGCINANDPIMEQLKQCPEAFKVGEILDKAFDSLKYAHLLALQEPEEMERAAQRVADYSLSVRQTESLVQEL